MLSRRLAIQTARCFRARVPAVTATVRRYVNATPRLQEGRISSRTDVDPGPSHTSGDSSRTHEDPSPTPEDNAKAITTLGVAAVGVGIVYGLVKWIKLEYARHQEDHYRRTEAHLNNIGKQLRVELANKATDPDKALEALEQQVRKYSDFLPGRIDSVDRILEDLQSLRRERPKEVEKIIMDNYGMLRLAARKRKGTNLEVASRAWNVYCGLFHSLADLAWEEALQKLSSMLENDLEVRLLVEQHTQILRQGHMRISLEKIAGALLSRQAESLQLYIDEQISAESFRRRRQSLDNGRPAGVGDARHPEAWKHLTFDSCSKWMRGVDCKSPIVPQLVKLEDLAAHPVRFGYTILPGPLFHDVPTAKKQVQSLQAHNVS